MARKRLANRGDPAWALTKAIYDDFGLRAAEPPLTADKTALPIVLSQRRGSCVGIASVYLSLAEALQLKAAAVLVPEHLFMRLRRGDRATNIETLRGGRSYGDAWYRKKHRVPSGVSAYMRDLSSNEFRGVVAYNLGNAYRKARRRKTALIAYTEATRLFPTFAEAHANRGLLLYLLGDYPAAKAAFARAAELYPRLPGLRENTAVLQRAIKRR